MKRSTNSERGVVLAPLGRDAAVAVAMLGEGGIEAERVDDLDALVAKLDLGAGFVVVTEEALATTDLNALSAWIADQENWSDLPFILITHRGGGLERNPAAQRYLEVLSNVTFLERPFHPTTLISLARAALRGRRRQYEARARLEALREGEVRLREMNATLERRVADALAERKVFADIVATAEGSFQVLDNDFRFQAVNAAAVADYERFFGAKVKVGDTMHEVLAHAPEELERALAIWGRALNGESIDETSWWSAPGLPSRAYEMQFRPLRDLEGRQVGAYLFGREVTDRLRDQQRLAEATAQLHETQKLEMLGQLTGGVAHDFNNLLTPIIGALDLLRTRPGGDSRSARLIDGALQSGERAKTLVQRLLGFARRQTLEPRAVDLRDLVENMRDLVVSSIGPGIEFRVLASHDLPPALADPNQLELAVLNLCVNARDAMPSGGDITIALEPLTIEPGDSQGLNPGEYQRLSVIDRGVGMDEATLKRAIEPFYSTKGVGKGTGLGLSMVHGLCAQLGGAFVLTSTPGVGTRAELYLPEAPPNARTVVPRALRPNVTGGPSLRVLLVDDEELVRAGTAEMLRALGHHVTEAAGGAEALRKLDGGLQIDVLVTDYTMPRMDGAELARQVAELRADARVLVITGYAGGDLDLGIPTLAKPFRQTDLAKALAEVVEPPPSAAPMEARV